MKPRTINEKFELQSKKRRNSKRKLKLLLALLRFILTLGLAAAVIIFAALSPLFNVRRIEVNGQKHYSSDEIRNVSGIGIDENGFRLIGSSLPDIFTFRIGGAENRLKQTCPYLSDVTARFVIPSYVVISVKERTPFAIVPFEGTSLVTDREAFVLESGASVSALKLPVIKGLEFEDYKLGGKLQLKNPDSFKAAISVGDVIRSMDGKGNTNLYQSVDAIDTADLQNVSISLDKRITVRLGDLEDLNYRISAANTIFTENIRKDQKGILDFTTEPNPVFSPERGG